MDTEEENGDMIFFDPEDGYIKSLEDLAALSIIDETETRPEVKHKRTLPAAPDGGYAWVICGAVFLNHMIYEGLGRAEGLFYIQFQSRFGASAQLAAWPTSLMSTVRMFMGPACAAMVNRYSVRTATIIGTFLCFAGMLLNSFAPNVYFLFLSHTILGGVGRGLLSGVVILNLYFDKHSSLANGLGSSGIGMGSLWTIPLVQYLFDEYGFTGTFIILSALILNGLLIAMLFRPLRLHYQFMTAKLLRKGIKTRMNEYTIPVLKETAGYDHVMLSTIDENAEPPEKNGQAEVPEKIEQAQEPETNDQTVELEKIEQAEEPENNQEAEVSPLLGYTNAASTEHISNKLSNFSSDDVKDKFIIIEPKTTRPETEENNDMEAVNKKDKSKGCLVTSLKICFPVEFKREGGETTSEMFHWGLMKNMPFFLYCCNGLLYLLSLKIALVFLPALAKAKGLSREEAALILSIMGGADTFGRIATGFLMDLKSMRRFRQSFFTCLLYFVAIDTIMIPFLTSFTSLSIACAIYGILTGAFVTQKTVYLVDILGRERFASGLGIQRLFQGFGTLVGPPLAGALRDALGNYDSSFYLGGGSMLGSALLMTLSVVLLKIQNRKSAL